MPYFPFQDDGVNLEMIQYDFPDLSQTEIEENIDVIDEYYGRALNDAIAKDYFRIRDLDFYVDSPTTYYPPRIPTHTSEANEGESKEDCIFRLGNINKWDFRQNYAIFFADRGAKSSSTNYYGDLGSNYTKRDALKHITWNALLSRLYWTTSSKQKKYNFAKKMSSLNERCAQNPVGALYMDYHNNEIGRQLYQKHTTYKKFLWMKTGLNEPSAPDLKVYAYELVESKAVFIDMKNLPTFGDITDPEELAYLKIIKTDKTKPVYLSKEENTDYYGN